MLSAKYAKFVSVVGGVMLLMMTPALSGAQSSGASGPQDARIHLGPLALNPRFSLTNLGVDTNALRTPAGGRRDFSAQLTPGLDSWLQVGPLLFSGRSTVGWTYFQRTRNQRSLDYSQDGRLDVLFTRLIPYAAVAYRTTRQRPNLEIDTRVRQKDQTTMAGTQVMFSSAFNLTVEVREQRLDFSDRNFGDPLLAAQLNRTGRTAEITSRIALTPLTTWTFSAKAGTDTFEFSSLRDSESTSLRTGFEFKPFEVISGTASVGVRRFDVKNPIVPDNTDLVASVDLSYLFREMTRFAVRVNRDVDYSFRETDPYFVDTTGGLTVTQAVGASWDVVGRYSRSRLVYQTILEGAEGEPVPIERFQTVGFGVGRHLASGMRIGFDVMKEERRSNVADRSYEGIRAGGSVTYGF